MKRYYITTKEVWQRHMNHFHPQYHSHYIDLPNGEILLAASFNDEFCESEFDTDVGVEGLLPHPLVAATSKLKKEHVDKLKHLDIKEEHTMLDLIQILGAKYHGLKLQGL